MKQIGTGKTIKDWYLANRPTVRRIMTPTVNSFHVLNLDEIEDHTWYVIVDKDIVGLIIEEAEMLKPREEDHV